MPFDVVIIGSGFGGSVCAARAAASGARTLVIERGPWWGPAGRTRPAAEARAFPRGVTGIRRMVRNVRTAGRRRGRELLLNPAGLYELHAFSGLMAVTGSGVGGGSHIYTNMLIEPPAELYDDFPDEISARSMQVYFDRVRAVLGPAPVRTPPGRVDVFEQAVRRARLGEPARPDLAIAWHDHPHGGAAVQRPACNECGNCIIGCERGSKSTLDLTYLPLALEQGAELRALTEATAVRATAAGYEIDLLDHRHGGHSTVRCKRLVIAAGGLNTMRLLFAARQSGDLPALSQSLGRHFSPNGDHLSLISGAGRELESSRGSSVNSYVAQQRNGHFHHLVGEVGLPLEGLNLPAAVRRRLEKTVGLISMGRDHCDATVEFDGRFLRTSLGRKSDPAFFEAVDASAAAIAAGYNARSTILNLSPLGRSNRLWTVHPVGGVAMGSSSRSAVVDHRGEVFGHPGLFIADGSLYPAPPGVPPSLMIAALAERIAETLA